MSELAKRLFEKLNYYGDGVSFHMPGHKGGHGSPDFLKENLGEHILRIDQTELPGLDNLNSPGPFFEEVQGLAAKTFRADNSYLLVNGSTCGNLTMFLYELTVGDKILVDRNAHKSAASALIVTGAVPVWLPNRYDPVSGTSFGIDLEYLEKACRENPDAKAVFITSPNYDGIITDLRAVRRIIEPYGMKLFVDEAHGALTALLPGDYLSAADEADAFVHSTHKTLSSFTQTSMLYTKKTMDPDRVKRTINLVQTTSPSYLLMLSLLAMIDECADHGREMALRAKKLCGEFQQLMQELPQVTMFGREYYTGLGCMMTPDRFMMGIDGYTGTEVAQYLYSQNVSVEKFDLRKILVTCSQGTEEADGERLYECIKNMPMKEKRVYNIPFPVIPPMVYTPRDAFHHPTEVVEGKDTLGRIAAEMIGAYPPGVPMLVPGERITEDAMPFMVDKMLVIKE